MFFFILFMRTVAHLNVLTSPVSKLCPRSILLILLAKNIFELTAQTIFVRCILLSIIPVFKNTGTGERRGRQNKTRGLRLN